MVYAARCAARGSTLKQTFGEIIYAQWWIVYVQRKFIFLHEHQFIECVCNVHKNGNFAYIWSRSLGEIRAVLPTLPIPYRINDVGYI